MKRRVKQIAIITAGAVLVLLGMVGLFLPFLQGVLFIAVGFFLLSLYSPRLRGWAESRTRRWPRLHSQVERFDAWARRILGEL